MLHRFHLTYANVMVTLLAFIVLGGGAYAAGHVGKNSVGAKQLKKNAVVTAKIKGAAVTKKKIENNAVVGAKIANGSVTGDKINAASTPFSQVVARLRLPSILHIATNLGVRTLGNYTQHAGEVDQFVGGFAANFGPAPPCEPPRKITAYLLLDPPAVFEGLPPFASIIGAVFFEENEGSGETTQLEFAPYSTVGAAMTRVAPSSDLQHTVSLFVAEAKCGTGGSPGMPGMALERAAVDVIGTSSG